MDFDTTTKTTTPQTKSIAGTVLWAYVAQNSAIMLNNFNDNSIAFHINWSGCVPKPDNYKPNCILMDRCPNGHCYKDPKRICTWLIGSLSGANVDGCRLSNLTSKCSKMRNEYWLLWLVWYPWLRMPAGMRVRTYSSKFASSVKLINSHN